MSVIDIVYIRNRCRVAWLSDRPDLAPAIVIENARLPMPCPATPIVQGAPPDIELWTQRIVLESMSYDKIVHGNAIVFDLDSVFVMRCHLPEQRKLIG